MHVEDVECWCGPQVVTTQEGRLYLHYDGDGRPPPATFVAQAAIELHNDTHAGGIVHHVEHDGE
jgi:hypothetical protein